MMMMISSQLYSNETPQGRKWSRVHLGARQWYQEAAARQRLECATGKVNVALEQLAHTPSAPLSKDLATYRVRWMTIWPRDL
jgi:hypothetical protein